MEGSGVAALTLGILLFSAIHGLPTEYTELESPKEVLVSDNLPEGSEAPVVDKNTETPSSLKADEKNLQQSTPTSPVEPTSTNEVVLSLPVAENSVLPQPDQSGTNSEKSTSELPQGEKQESIPNSIDPASPLNTVALNTQSDFFITKAFFINRGKDWERRERTENELKRVGLAYERVEAITPEDLCSHHYDYLIQGGSKWAIDCNNKDPNHQRNMRSMCCDVAHRVAVDKISRQPDGIYLLLEDDVHFEDGWYEALAQAWRVIPSDWAVARAGSWGMTDPGDKVNDKWFASNRHTPGNAWDADKPYYYGGHAIITDPSHAKRMLSGMVARQADMFDQFTANGAIGPSYTMTTSVITVNGMPSVKEMALKMFMVDTDAV